MLAVYVIYDNGSQSDHGVTLAESRVERCLPDEGSRRGEVYSWTGSEMSQQWFDLHQPGSLPTLGLD